MHTPTPWEKCTNKAGRPSMRPAGKHGMIASYFAREADQTHAVACVNAFHDDQGRTLDNISQGLV